MPRQMNARMTLRQRRFVTEYLVDFNARKAAIRAGYAAKGAAHQAWQLLNWRPNVAEAVKEGMKAREVRTLITADKALQELARIAFSDIARLLETDAEGRVRAKPLESLSAADTAAIVEWTVTEKSMRIRLHDKRAALVEINRHLGLVGKQSNSQPGLRAKDELPAREILRRRLAQMAGEKM